mgnify:FL=1
MFEEIRGKVALKSISSKRISKEQDDIEYYQSYYMENGVFPDFTQVLIETQTDCNRSCSFCPQSESIRPYKQIEWSTYTTIIDQLGKGGFSGRIALFMTNEPLLDKELINRIIYAKKVSPKFFIDINTNGNLLDINKIDQLFAAGLDNLSIDDYRSDRDKNPFRLTPNIEDVMNRYKHNPKVQVAYRRTDEVLSNRAGSVEKKVNHNLPKNSFCNYPFRKLAIGPYGDIVLCCLDYNYSIKCGNIMEKNIYEIWHSDVLDKYRLELLDKNRKGLCRKCDHNDYPEIDNQFYFIGKMKNFLKSFIN